MARRVRNTNLETRTAREKLKQAGKPYYAAIGPGLHIGFRKNKSGGRWVVRIYDEEQRTYQVETLAAADDVLDADGVTVLDFWQAQEQARAKARKQAGQGERKAGSYKVRDAIEDYLNWLEANRKSASDARYRAEALILPQLGGIEVAKLTTDKLRAWLKKTAEAPPRLRTKKGDAPRHREADEGDEAIRKRRASTNRVLTTLKAALNFAFNEEKVAIDRAWKRVQPFRNVDQPRVRYLTIAEAKRLINASEPDFRSLVQAALQTGCRYGELAAMLVNDFNPDTGTVAVRQSKAGKSRHVVLTEEGVEFFSQATAGCAGDETIFQKSDGSTWGKSHQNRPMADACARAKISPPISFHILRHSWASLAVMAGVPLMVIAKNLGHSDTRMVERHYGHMTDSYVAEAIRAGAPRFGTLQPSNVKSFARAGT